MEAKKQIRKRMLKERDAVPVHMRMEMSSEIFLHLETLPEFKQAERILLFAGYGSEPDTIAFMDRCIAGGKKVFCPVVLGEVMEFYEVTDSSRLKYGYKGIPEPDPSNNNVYRGCEHDLMILPGVAFDREGNRIGYGKGFYDRYLASGFSGKLTAIAFSFQILENGEIPAEKTDRKVNCIVTENEIIRM